MIVTQAMLDNSTRSPETMVIEEILKGLNVTVSYRKEPAVAGIEHSVCLQRDANNPTQGIFSTLVAGIGAYVIG